MNSIKCEACHGTGERRGDGSGCKFCHGTGVGLPRDIEIKITTDAPATMQTYEIPNREFFVAYRDRVTQLLYADDKNRWSGFKKGVDQFGEICGYILVPFVCLALFALAAVVSAALTLGKYSIAYHLLSSVFR